MSREVKLLHTTVAHKLLLAVTGIVLLLFVIGHLAGNLQIYRGPEALNGYAALLHANPGPVWAARLILLFSVGVHIAFAARLAWRNWRARPVGYARRRWREADVAARSMVLTGPVIAAFVVYHLLHLTFGSVHPEFVPRDVYHNVVAGFRVLPVAIAYIVANVLLAFHLFHGTWSLTQTLGMSHPRWDGLRRTAATVVAVLIGAGNVSIPLAVWAGWVR
ncbi:MAG: succinate dehydrogenase cytochrome b subunit [Acidobacteriota bacterium]|jgi:succinate dehydrogenase / fumarate reductase cytochrome b subunit